MEYPFAAATSSAQWPFDAQQPHGSAQAAPDWVAAMPADAPVQTVVDTSHMFFSAAQFTPQHHQQQPYYGASAVYGDGAASTSLAPPWFGPPANGHAPATRLQAQPPSLSHHNTSIDPSFVLQNNHHHYASPIHPMVSPPTQHHHQPHLPVAISPAILQLSSLPPPPPTPPKDTKPTLTELLKPLLATKKLESTTQAKSAVSEIVELVERHGGPAKIESTVRREMMARIRDYGGAEFLSAWVKNVHAMNLVRVWLKNAVTGKDDRSDESNDTLIALLMVITRLPLTVETLRDAQIGRYIKHISKEPPSNAIKSVAQNLETSWREMIQRQQEDADDDKQEDRKRKRKQTEAGTGRDTPPAKKQATTATNSMNGGKPIAVKKEIKSVAVVKDAKSDSSFFSAPKAKPKLPTFTKKSAVPTPQASTSSSAASAETAAPAAGFNPFADAWKSIQAVAPPEIAESNSASTPSTIDSVGGNAPGKKKKRVTFAPEASLVAVKYIDRAVYDDDHNDFGGALVRDLDRAEGAAMHQHPSNKLIDWYEPQELDLEGSNLSIARGEGSKERVAQEEREAKTLAAIYESTADIPPSPAEAPPVPDDLPEPKVMLCGSELDALTSQIHQQPASVQDLLGQLASTTQQVPPPDAPMSVDPPAQVAEIPDRERLQQLLAQFAQQSNPGANPPPAAAHDVPTIPPSTDIWAQYTSQQQPAGQPLQQPQSSWQQQPGQHPGNRNQRSEQWQGRGGPRGRGGFRGRRTPCRFYLQGNCKFGENCDFLHERE